MKKKDKKRVELDNRTNVNTPFAANHDYGEPGLGTGLYRGPMDRFKSITDFLNKSRKNRRKKRKKLLAEMLIGGKNVALFTDLRTRKLRCFSTEMNCVSLKYLKLSLPFFTLLCA